MSYITKFPAITRGEIYIFENAVEAEIRAVAQWHPAIGTIEGDTSGFTYKAGTEIAVLSFADYSGTVAGTIKATTDGAHGYSTGEPVTLVGPLIEVGDADPYYDQYMLTVIDADEFYFTSADWNDTQTAWALQPSYLKCDVGSAGDYLFNGTASVHAVANDKTVDFRLFNGTAGSEKSEARFQAKISGEYHGVAGSSFLAVAEGDYIWFGVKGITDDTNILIRYANLNLHRM